MVWLPKVTEQGESDRNAPAVKCNERHEVSHDSLKVRGSSDQENEAPEPKFSVKSKRSIGSVTSSMCSVGSATEHRSFAGSTRGIIRIRCFSEARCGEEEHDLTDHVERKYSTFSMNNSTAPIKHNVMAESGSTCTRWDEPNNLEAPIKHTVSRSVIEAKEVEQETSIRPKSESSIVLSLPDKVVRITKQGKVSVTSLPRRAVQELCAEEKHSVSSIVPAEKPLTDKRSYGTILVVIPSEVLRVGQNEKEKRKSETQRTRRSVASQSSNSPFAAEQKMSLHSVLLPEVSKNADQKMYVLCSSQDKGRSFASTDMMASSSYCSKEVMEPSQPGNYGDDARHTKGGWIRMTPTETARFGNIREESRKEEDREESKSAVTKNDASVSSNHEAQKSTPSTWNSASSKRVKIVVDMKEPTSYELVSVPESEFAPVLHVFGVSEVECSSNTDTPFKNGKKRDFSVTTHEVGESKELVDRGYVFIEKNRCGRDASTTCGDPYCSFNGGPCKPDCTTNCHLSYDYSGAGRKV